MKEKRHKCFVRLMNALKVIGHIVDIALYSFIHFMDKIVRKYPCLVKPNLCVTAINLR